LKQGQPNLGRIGRWLAVLAALVYLGLLIRYVNACAGGSDSSGYMNHARILATGRVHIPPRALPSLNARHYSSFLYSPLGLKPVMDGAYLVPTYPVGLPLLILAAKPLAGWAHAFDLVIIVHAVAGLALVFVLGRVLRFSPGWSLAAVVLTALSPVFLEYSLQGMSDMPAMVWATAVVAAAWGSRERLGWSLVAGFCLGIAVLIRPNNVLLAAPVAVAWWPGLSWKSIGQAACRVGLLLLGGLPAAIFFVLHSRAAYGDGLITGYGDPSQLFVTDVIRETLASYAKWIPQSFTPGVWLFLLLPLFAVRSRRALLLFVWGFAYLAFYVSYVFTHETWWYLRFILPAAPALVYGMLLVLERFSYRRWLPAALALGLAWQCVTIHEKQVFAVGHGEGTYPKAMQWIREHVPHDAVLATMQTSGAAFYYTDLIFVRYDNLDPKNFPEFLAALKKDHRPLYAALFNFEVDELKALQDHMPGSWVAVGTVRDVTIWRFRGPGISHPS
jgi:hypothetical protein